MRNLQIIHQTQSVVTASGVSRRPEYEDEEGGFLAVQSPLTRLVAVGSKGAGLDQSSPHKLHHDGQAPLGHK